MEYKEFVQSTVCRLAQSVFDEYKDMLIGQHITFSFIGHDAVTIDILAEKICDYFAALELKTGKAFDKRLDSFMDDMDSIVGPHIAKAPQVKKGDTAPAIVPRARKYYEKALQYKGLKKPEYTHLIDYFRIMMCLYTAVIRNNGKLITNFDFSSECLEPGEIIRAMMAEETAGILPNTRKKRFDTANLYDSDTCTVIIAILFLWTLMSDKIRRDTDHE